MADLCWSQQDERLGIIGTDNRQAADSTMAPWRSIGRINHAGFRDLAHCTGTLIAPTIVATAAHCLFHPRSHKPLPLGGFRLVLGFHQGEYLALGRIKCVKIAPGFDAAARTSAATVPSDVAIAVLDRPVTEKPVELTVGESLSVGAVVTHAGYGRDRPNLLSVHRNCSVLAATAGLLVTDCDTNFGQSGGPILAEKDGAYQLAGTMSGIIAGQGSVAIPAAALQPLLEGADCEE